MVSEFVVLSEFCLGLFDRTEEVFRSIDHDRVPASLREERLLRIVHNVHTSHDPIEQ